MHDFFSNTEIAENVPEIDRELTWERTEWPIPPQFWGELPGGLRHLFLVVVAAKVRDLFHAYGRWKQR